jgi:hypothetical protein
VVFREAGPPSPNLINDSTVRLISPLKRVRTAEFLLSSGNPISRKAASFSSFSLSLSLLSLTRGFDGLFAWSSVRKAFSIVGSSGGRFFVSRFDTGYAAEEARNLKPKILPLFGGCRWTEGAGEGCGDLEGGDLGGMPTSSRLGGRGLPSARLLS